MVHYKKENKEDNKKGKKRKEKKEKKERRNFQQIIWKSVNSFHVDYIYKLSPFFRQNLGIKLNNEYLVIMV